MTIQKPTIEQLCYSKLLAYITASWNGYIIARHHLIVANALEAVERGEIKRLIINLPPRSGKTMELSEFFPAWYWGRNPDKKIIFLTHGQEKADDVGRMVRDQLIDPLHRRIFPACQVSESSKSIHRMNTKQRGEYYSIGMGGQIVGRGAHLLIIDDPIKGRAEADSTLKQNRLRAAYQGDIYTRLMSGNAIIVCQTRWTNNDLTGWLLTEHKRENWTVINIPAIAEVDNDILRRSTGDTIWPEMEIFTKEYLELVKATVGTREWNAQYQQRPIDIEGGIVKLSWFKYYTVLPEFERIVQSWDSVHKDGVLTLKHDGLVKIMSLEDLWGIIDSNVEKNGNREVKQVSGWQVWGKEDFTDIKYILRHPFNGKLKKVENRCGGVLVTDNHSIINEKGERVKPEDISHRTNLPWPRYKRVPTVSNKSTKHALFIGSKELAWTCGFFVAEGSTSIKTIYKETHIPSLSVSIANKDIATLYRCQKAIKENLNIDTGIYGPDKTGMHRLCSNDKNLYYYFNRFYDSKREKIVSDDLFNAYTEVKEAFLDGYIEGDGHYTGKSVDIVTKSQTLVYQIAWMINVLTGNKPRFYHRRDKPNIYRFMAGNHRSDTLTNKVTDVEYDGYVYDLETESHTFRAGNILVSNTASKPEEINDPSVCTTWGITGNAYYLIDVFRKRLEYPALKKAVVKLYDKFHPSAVLIEDKSSGTSLIQDIRYDTKIPVIAIDPKNVKKEIRMSVESDKIEAGRVFLPEKASWLVDYETELTQFPLYANDDMVDSTSQFLKWIAGKGFSGMVRLTGL